MNLALSTLIVFLLLLPGIVFRRFYYSEEFSKEYFKSTILEVFISALIPSIGFQVIWFYIAKLLNQPVDLQILGDLMSSAPSPSSYLNIQNNAVSILLYNTTMVLSAAFCGRVFKQIVRTFKWDRKHKHFRFQNSWHYLLKGEFFDFPRAQLDLEEDTVERIEIVFVDALVGTGDGVIIYDGILVDYELSKDGGLEIISLKQAERRYLNNDPKIQKREKKKKDKFDSLKSEGEFNRKQVDYYQIPGHILVLKNSDIINLNFTYYKLEVTEDGYLVVPVQ